MLQMFDNDPKHEPEQAPAQYDDDVDDVGVGEPSHECSGSRDSNRAKKIIVVRSSSTYVWLK